MFAADVQPLKLARVFLFFLISVLGQVVSCLGRDTARYNFIA